MTDALQASDNFESPEAYEITSLSQQEFDGSTSEQGEDDLADAADATDVAALDDLPEPDDAAKQQDNPLALFQQYAEQQERRFAALLQMQQDRSEQLIASLLDRLAPQQAPVDPFSQLDPDDPDYSYKQLELKNKLLQERLDKLEGSLTTRQQQQEQERQRAEQQAQMARLTQWRDENVTKAADLLFAGFPASQLVNQAKDTVAIKFDSEWRALSEKQYGVPYHKDAYAVAFNRVKPQMAMFAHLKAAAKRQTPAAPQAQQSQPSRQAQSSTSPSEFVPYFQRKSGL